MGWEYTDFQREELYEQVWTEAVSKVAKRYGISDVGLRKICVSLEVPMWSKPQAFSGTSETCCALTFDIPPLKS